MKNKKKHNGIVLLTRSKLNSIEKIISKALIHNDKLMNGEKRYSKLKENIRIMRSQKSDIERD